MDARLSAARLVPPPRGAARILLVAFVLVASASRAAPPLVTGRVPCAAGGPPVLAGGGVFDEGMAPSSIGVADPTALLRLRVAPWVSGPASDAAGDPATTSGVLVERARLGVCGVATPGGELAYRVVWEPWDRVERARVDGEPWGRFTDLSLAWVPRPWAQVSLGIGKVPLSRAREQPEGALALPGPAHGITQLVPDRRLGAFVDADLGVARLALAATMASPRATGESPGGVLLAGRLVLEPIGPVGRGGRPDPVEPLLADVERAAQLAGWVARPRFAVGLSAAWRSGTPGAAWLVGLDAALTIGRARLGLDAVVTAADWSLSRWAEREILVVVAPDAQGRRPSAVRVAIAAEQVVRLYRDALHLALREELLDEGPGGRPRLLRFEAGLSATLRDALTAQLAWTRTVPLAGAPLDAGPDAVTFDLQLAR